MALLWWNLTKHIHMDRQTHNSTIPGVTSVEVSWKPTSASQRWRSLVSTSGINFCIIDCLCWFKKQGHHHNADHVALRPHILYSIWTFTHFEFWRNLCDYLWHIASLHNQPACFQNVFYWHFCQSPTVWLQFERGLFGTLRFEGLGKVSWIGQFVSPPKNRGFWTSNFKI